MQVLDSLIKAALPDVPKLDMPAQEYVEQQTIAAARRHLARAPAQVRYAFAVMVATFCVYVFITQGRWVTRLPAERRSTLMARFTERMPAIFSAMERLIRSVSLLAFFDDALVLEALGYRSLASNRDLRRRERERLT